MELKYRVLGKVNNAFILRGVYFASNKPIDFCISEKEVDFVKARCEITELQSLVQNPAIPSVKKESQNDKSRTSESSRSESKGTTKLPVANKR